MDKEYMEMIGSYSSPIPMHGLNTLKERIEDNNEEPTIECEWCHEEFTEDELLKERDLGYICYHCALAIKSRGEKLYIEY